jgi:hypothetical protein
MNRFNCENYIGFLTVRQTKRPLIDSTFKTYMDPEALKETEIDRQIPLHHLLIVMLMP